MNKKPFIFLTVLLLLTLVVGMVAHLSGPRLLSAEHLAASTDRSEEQLVFRFSRPMNEENFAQYFSLSPEIPGRMSWSDGALYFTPEQSLPSGQTITARFSEEAKDVYGRRLGKKTEKQFHFAEPRFIYINEDGQLTRGSLSSEHQVLTKQKNIRDYVIDAQSHRLWFLHQPHPSDATELWSVDFSGKEQQHLPDKNFQIRTLRLAKKGEEILLLTQPLLAETNEALSLYAYLPKGGTIEHRDLGELGQALSQFSVSGDGNTLVLTHLDGSQYLRNLLGNKTSALTKLSTYRGSNRLGTMLVFEDIVPDKNYTGEVVLYDGGYKRIVSDDATLLMPTLSPDGKSLAYSYQPRSAAIVQEVVAGESLEVLFTVPVSGIRWQNTRDVLPAWEYYHEDWSYELPQFSPDSSLVAVESFSADSLQNLKDLREFGEPNKPSLGVLRFFDRSGKLLPNQFPGRELKWIDESRVNTK